MDLIFNQKGDIEKIYHFNHMFWMYYEAIFSKTYMLDFVFWKKGRSGYRFLNDI